jgi:DNA-binding NarL/FixJ family response regulator
MTVRDKETIQDTIRAIKDMPDPLARALQCNELIEICTDALETLRGLRREAITGMSDNGQGPSQIAKSLNLSLSTVKAARVRDA